MLKNQWYHLAIIIVVGFIAGCAQHTTEQSTSEPIDNPSTVESSAKQAMIGNNDPLEPVNRAVWNFNYNYLDKPIYRPIVHGYVNHVPSNGRKSINNFMRNLEEPASMVNNLLQLKFKAALHNLTRFVFNSTLGGLGFIDVMGRAGLKRDLSDFNDVLASYGVGDGPYVMLPVMGPSTPRQITGDLVDQLYFPFAQFSWVEKAVRWGVNGVTLRASVIKQEGLVDNALDPYGFVKNAYLQYRRYRYHQGENAHQAEPLNTPKQVDMSQYMDEIEGSD